MGDIAPNRQVYIRQADAGDADGVARLAAELASSFVFSREKFLVSYSILLGDEDACVLVAVNGDEHLGYLLGFAHVTFYANGPVGWVEEVAVQARDRGLGVGRALMTAFEHWAAARECALVALATRRAAPFYLALGYEESATYFRKILTSSHRYPARSGRAARPGRTGARPGRADNVPDLPIVET
jgi:GNAT superfamily N-acetyltransferase